MRKKHLPMLVLCIIGSELIGTLGSFATIPNIPTWYKGLIKPPLNPPNWIFGPVWTLLFALMGISVFLVWHQRAKKKSVKKTAFLWFGIQFACNILWSFLFFGAHSPALGLICIGMLLISILLTIQSFMKMQKTAGMLLVPYVVWVSFAAYLNAGILLLN